MKKFLIASGILFCFSVHTSTAQTKRIAHKSHSGHEETFALAYENHLFDMDLYNEGIDESAMEYYRKVQLNALPDTMIFVKDKMIPAYKRAVGKDSLFGQKPVMADSVRSHFKKQYSSDPAAQKKKDGAILLPITTDNTIPPAAPGMPLMYIAITGLFSLFAGLFSWQYKYAEQ